MKSLLTLLLLIPAFLSAQPQQLFDFQELLTALEQGYRVAARFDYEQCELITDGKKVKSPAIRGGMDISCYEFFDSMSVNNPLPYLSFSETVLINHPRHGFVHNYVRVRVFSDNRVEIRAMYLTPGTMGTVMDETFKGRISMLTQEMGAKFFKK